MNARLVTLGTNTYHWALNDGGVGDLMNLELWSSYPPSTNNLVMVYMFDAASRSTVSLLIDSAHRVDVRDLVASIAFAKRFLTESYPETIFEFDM